LTVHSRIRASNFGVSVLASWPAWRENSPAKPLCGEALTPPIDKRIIAVELVADLGPGVARLQQQHQARPARIVCATGSARHSVVQFHAFSLRQRDRVHGHDHTPFLVVTVH